MLACMESGMDEGKKPSVADKGDILRSLCLQAVQARFFVCYGRVMLSVGSELLERMSLLTSLCNLYNLCVIRSRAGAFSRSRFSQRPGAGSTSSK